MTRRNKIFIAVTLCSGVVGAVAVRSGVSGIGGVPLDHQLLQQRGLLMAALACWAVFSLYWEKASKSAAAAQQSESKGSRGVHVFLTNTALLLEILPIRGLGRFVAVSPVIMTAGLAVEGAGLALAIWARRHLGRNWSGAIAIKVEHELVRSGPYRMVRHPIYTGILAMYAGMAVVTGEWLAAIGLAMAVFAYWRKIRLEEATLDRAFGSEYDSYRRATWALLPGFF